MDKVYCKTRRVIIEHSKGGPILDVEYVPDASYTWEQVTAFFKYGTFALKFEGPEGMVAVQPVEVETATSLTDQPGILVGLGKHDSKRIPPGQEAWLERSDR